MHQSGRHSGAHVLLADGRARGDMRSDLCWVPSGCAAVLGLVLVLVLGLGPGLGLGCLRLVQPYRCGRGSGGGEALARTLR